VVEESVSMPERPLHFEVTGDAGILPAQVTTTLAVVVTELIQNAVDHAFVGSSAPEDGSPGRVEVSLDRRPDMLVIDVVDDGIGLPDDFDLSDATGLGLTLVRTFVEVELGGTISLRPGDDDGTVAEVRIPSSRLVSPLDDARDPRA
jgi:two-component sensor histidine kinase